MFARLGPWCHDKRRLVLVLWILLLIGVNALSSSIGDNYRQSFNLPGAESSKGFDILKEKFGGMGAGQGGTIVFRARQGVMDAEVKAAMSTMFDKVGKFKGIARVESPYAPGGERFISANGPQPATIAYANVEFPEDIDFGDVPAIKDKVEASIPKVDGLQVELGGQIFAAFEPPTSEIIGLAFAIVILILAFGSVLAMGLPVAVALTGIGIGGALVILFSHIVQVPEFAPFIGVMIGLGVGIDYALLIVTRYREQLHANHTVRESVQIAIDTAGRSVLFAGITVVISLLGMLLMGVGFVQGLAVSAAATVAITVMASLTLLPALLGFAGPRIEKRRRAGLISAGLVAVGLLGVGFDFKPLMLAFGLAVVVLLAGFFVPALKSEVEHRPARPRRETLAYRWSRGIQHRPWAAALASSVVLLILAIPVLHLRLAFSDESNYPETTTTKKAYNLLVQGFGKGYNGPILLVADGAPSSPEALAAVKAAVQQDPNVVFVTDPIPNNPAAPTAVLWNVVPKTGPQEEATTQLVNRLRKRVLPPVESAIGAQIAVTGFTPANTDFAHVLSSRMPYFFLAVLALSFLLLMAVFRSLLVPLKAVIMNLLSIGASYGIVVALFQWGWFGDITGLSAAPIEPWAPMMLFAIVFGLSMDYEVFLLSRVREEWLRTGDSHTSVADGLAATAKVITAAAAIMVVVFGAFIFESDRTTKLMGTGLGLAILLDATIVRMLLVPATMELLGDKNWWLPGWLDRLLPNVSVEGTTEGVALLDDDDDERELQPV